MVEEDVYNIDEGWKIDFDSTEKARCLLKSPPSSMGLICDNESQPLSAMRMLVTLKTSMMEIFCSNDASNEQSYISFCRCKTLRKDDLTN